MTRRSAKDAAALLRQALAALDRDEPQPANDEIDEEAIRELARKDAEQMRKARNG